MHWCHVIARSSSCPVNDDTRHGGDRDHLEALEVDAVPPDPLPEPHGIVLASREEVGQQLAAHPVLGGGHRAVEEEDQRGDDRAALQGAALGGREWAAAPPQHQGAQVLGARQRRGEDDPGACLHAASRSQRLGQ